MDKRLEQIKFAEDKIRELEQSNENKNRMSYWADDITTNDYIWHPVPKNVDCIPFSIEIERAGYAKLLNFSLVKFYTDPIEHVLRNLECMIFKFESFEDCSPVGKGFPYWAGVGFEASLYGARQMFSEEDSWSSREHLIKERIDLNTLQLGDFYNSPVMKDTHEFYNRMVEIMSKDFLVTFPQWCRSPFGVAWPLRGTEDLIIDFCDDREWFESFIRKLTEDRISWSKQRAKHLGTDLIPVSFFNDEVTNPIVSPAMYSDVIFDSEVAISNAFGGLSYWHSCGDTTIFIPKINEIPNVHMVHISPWTDLASAVKGYSKTKALEIVLNPVEDILYPKDESIPKKKLEEIKTLTSFHRSTVRADGFAVISDQAKELKLIQEWAKMAKKVLIG